MRLIPLPIHAAIEALGGLLLIALPFLVGFSIAAATVSIVLGILLVGLALDQVDERQRDLPLSAHFSFDLMIGVALATAALGLAVAEDMAAATIFAIGALAHLALTLTTRYSAR